MAKNKIHYDPTYTLKEKRQQWADRGLNQKQIDKKTHLWKQAIRDHGKAGVDQGTSEDVLGDENATTGASNAFIREILDSLRGQPLDFSGAPALPTTGEIEADRTKFANADYANLTQDFAQQKALDQESMKQELANRGIPFDPGADPASNLYARSIQGVNTQWDKNYANARNTAMLESGTEMVNQMNVAKTARDTFVNEATTKHNAMLQELETISGLKNPQLQLNAWLTKYGADLDAATRQRVAQIAANASSSSSSDDSPVIGNTNDSFTGG